MEINSINHMLTADDIDKARRFDVLAMQRVVPRIAMWTVVSRTAGLESVEPDSRLNPRSERTPLLVIELRHEQA